MLSFVSKFAVISLIVLSLFLLPGNTPWQPKAVHATLGGYSNMPYDAGNIFPTQSMTVSNFTVNSYRYVVDVNNQMHLMVDAYNGTLGGTFASAFLCVKIPEGRTAHTTVTVPALIATDNGNSGTWEAAYGLVSANSGAICFRRASGANFVAATGTFRLDANVTLEVNDAP
jgi:hypothetical protein